MIKTIINLWFVINSKRKTQLIRLLFYMMLNGFAEVFSIAAIIPFLSVLIEPQKLWEISFIRSISLSWGYSNSKDLILPITLIFIFAVSISAFIRLKNLWLNTQLAAAIGTDLSFESFKIAIYQSYESHLRRNSSQIINTSTRHADSTVSFITSTLLLINSIVIGLFITSTLFIINWKTSLGAVLIFVSTYLIIASINKNQILTNGIVVEKNSNQQVKILQEGLGAIREVILNNSQEYYMKNFKEVVLPMRKSEASTTFISMFPRFTLDAFGLILISTFAYLLTLNSGDDTSIITTLGVFALGAQRLLPTMQQVYGSWSGMCGQIASVDKLLMLLNETALTKNKKEKVQPLKFENFIKLQNINFNYIDSSKILENVSFKISKGERVGIVGETGSGKSTLMDILMGLIKPDSGKILIDDVILDFDNSPEKIYQWHASIAHVPQQIYLSDVSIMENIAFCKPRIDIDFKKVYKSAQEAQILDFIESTKDKFETIVGERGVKLSGGQLQRIGIARALYKGAKVLIFDEATSALDKKTEMNLMESINRLSKDLTIILITHRISSIQSFDKIIEIKNKNAKIISNRYEK